MLALKYLVEVKSNLKFYLPGASGLATLEACPNVRIAYHDLSLSYVPAGRIKASKHIVPNFKKA